jgi:hypothetical protein
MTGGKIASLLFGIREPTEVILTYHQEDTTITLRKVSNVEQVNNQTMKPFERNTYTLHQFDDDGMFGWEQTVTKALASETKNQVLVSSITNYHTLNTYFTNYFNDYYMLIIC